MTMPMIQLKVAGAWRDVISVDNSAIDNAHATVQATLRALRIAVMARMLSDDGQATAIPDEANGWRRITDIEPRPLHDVIVTVFADVDDEPLTFMAYRKSEGAEDFILSGTNDERLQGAYAYRECEAAAPLSMRGAQS